MRIVEKGKVVLYTTSMRIVRETHDKCKRVKNILQTHMVQYEEKDIFMSRENQETLMNRLGINHVDVPQVFADGQHLGVSLYILLFFNHCHTHSHRTNALRLGLIIMLVWFSLL